MGNPDSYLTGAIYGLCILSAFVGWGAIVELLLFRQRRWDWGLRSAWGMALTLALGGILNLTWLISSGLLLAYVAVGALFLAAESVYRVLQHRHRPAAGRDPGMLRWWSWLVLAPIWLLLLLRFGGSLTQHYVNPHDDCHAYFVFPQKMLHTGSMGPDPFSERRMTSSFGGESFLDAIVLSRLGESSLWLMDAGIATLMLAGLVWGHLRRQAVSTGLIALALLAVLVVRPPRVNITSILTSTVLYVALYRTLVGPTPYPLRRAALAGLLIAGACSLKMNMVPVMAIVLVLTCAAAWWPRPGRRAALSGFLMSAAVAGALLLPWMISLYQSSATLMYPVLGQGYHATAYGDFPHQRDKLGMQEDAVLLSRIFADAAVLGVALAVATVLAMRAPPPRQKQLLAVFAVGAVIAAAALQLAVAGSDDGRYRFPLLLGVFIVAGMEFCAGWNPWQVAGAAWVTAACALVAAAGLVLHYASDIVVFSQTFGDVMVLGVALSVAAVLTMGAPGRRRKLSLAAFIVAAIVAAAALQLAIGANDEAHYRFPFVLGVFILVAVELCVCWNRWQVTGAVCVAAACTFVAATGLFLQYPNLDQLRAEVFGPMVRLVHGQRNAPVATDLQNTQYRAMQAAVPAGSVLLARLALPFLLDFRRNPVFIVDLPGAASPPPGMPCFHGPEPLAAYLRNQGIRYVAYSYASQAGMSKRGFAFRLKPPTSVWLMEYAAYTFDFQDNLEELGATRKRIFDDGVNFVLDLDQRLR